MDKVKTPPEAARLLRVKPEKVRAWIAKGELRAVNVGDRTRPRWRIMAADLASFLARRSATPPPKPAPRRRRKQSAGIIEFY